MIINKNSLDLWCKACLLLSVSSLAQAKNELHPLMTARDIRANTFSNVTIQNKTGAPITVYGLYVNQFAKSTTNCTAPAVLYSASLPANAGGAFVTPVFFTTNQKIPIGQNYLYNMLYTAIYYGNQSTAMPCTLPGCSWPLDTCSLVLANPPVA